MRLTSYLTCVLTMGIAWGCGGKTGDDAAPPADSGALTDSTSVLDSPLSDGRDVGRDDAVTDDAACDRAANGIAALVGGLRVTTLVRVGTDTHTIVGWSLTAGKPTTVEELGARKAFAPQVAPYTKVEDYTLVTGSGAESEFVFFHSPSDFGGLGVVSGRTGELVFAGQLSWSALGRALYPTTFRSPGELQSICVPTELPAPHVIGADGAEFDIAMATNAFARTPLVHGIRKVHTLLGITYVGFPVDGAPADGAPKNEVLVFIESALLE